LRAGAPPSDGSRHRSCHGSVPERIVPSAEASLRSDALLDSAAALIAARGYDRSSFTDFAAAAGVAPHALRKSYSGKAQILVALFRRMLDRMEAGADAAGGSFDDLLQAHARTIAENIDVVPILFAQDLLLPERLRAPIQERRRAYTDRLLDAYREGAARGEYRADNSALIVFLAVGAANSLSRWYRPGGRMNPTEVAAFIRDILRSGYGGRLA
jgi:TetR/AcrR family transcriptional regulator